MVHVAVVVLTLAAAATDDAARAQPATRQAADLEGVHQAVARYAIETLEPPCRNYWDGKTYCLELENGGQPTLEFLKQLRDVAPHLHSTADCEQHLGLEGRTTDPSIHIRSVTFLSKDEAAVDMVAFCAHGTPTVKREAGRWKVTKSAGGWVGSCPLPGDCAAAEPRLKRKRP